MTRFLILFMIITFSVIAGCSLHGNGGSSEYGDGGDGVHIDEEDIYY